MNFELNKNGFCNILVLCIVLLSLTNGCKKNEKISSVSELKHDDNTISKYIDTTYTLNIKIPDSLGLKNDIQILFDSKLNIYAKLIPNYYIGKWDKNGSFIQYFGKYGFGPDEIIAFGYFTIIEDSIVVGIDNTNHSFYKTNGGAAKKFRINSSEDVMCFLMLDSLKMVTLESVGIIENDSHIKIWDSIYNSPKLQSEYLRGNNESIRTQYIQSTAICKNRESTIITSFLPAKELYVISKSNDFSTIPILDDNYQITDTKILINKYETGKGFIPEIFNHSRILSVGFINNDIFAISFATKALENSKFYLQLYSLKQGKAITKSFQTDFGYVFTGIDGYFAAWEKEKKSNNSENNRLLSIIKFSPELYEK